MSKYNNMKSIPIDSLNEEKLKIYNINKQTYKPQ